VSEISLNKPDIPFISNVTGTWTTEQEVTNPGYWARHLKETVRFADGIKELAKKKDAIFVEIGPGIDLSALVARYTEDNPTQQVISLIRHSQKDVSDVYFLMNNIGRLWLYGVNINWNALYTAEKRQRLPLPTYPFERQRYWIDGEPFEMGAGKFEKSLAKSGIKKNISDWFYIPAWKPSLLPGCLLAETTASSTCLVFINEYGLGTQLVKRLKQDNRQVVTVKPGPGFKKDNEGSYTVDFAESGDYKTLFNELQTQNISIGEIIHMWSVGGRKPGETRQEWFRHCQYSGYYSLVFLSQAIGEREYGNDLRITVVSNNMQGVNGEELLYPEKATLLGPVNIIPKEYPHLKCRSIDIALPDTGSWQAARLLDQLVQEINADAGDAAIVYRGANRLVQFYEPVKLEKITGVPLALRDKGVYLITGGLGAIGLLLAEHLARLVRARLILTGRSTFPTRNRWEQWVETHPVDDVTSLKIKKL
ncbi:MAG: KR domain-containing protein, partial [bacterium]|nr:KR domain-containing protein [bacterium]